MRRTSGRLHHFVNVEALVTRAMSSRPKQAKIVQACGADESRAAYRRAGFDDITLTGGRLVKNRKDRRS